MAKISSTAHYMEHKQLTKIPYITNSVHPESGRMNDCKCLILKNLKLLTSKVTRSMMGGEGKVYLFGSHIRLLSYKEAPI